VHEAAPVYGDGVESGTERQPWRLTERQRRMFDLALVGGLLLVVPLIGVSVGLGNAVFSLLEIAPLAWRRSRPVAVFAAVAVVTGLQAVVLDVPTWGQVAFPIATYAIARYSTWLPGAVALGVGCCGALVAAYVWQAAYNDVTWQGMVTYTTFIAAIVATAWALGTLGRTRAAYVAALVERGERIEREAAQQVELAATEERARIAREMHDVVAHGLSVIVVQADGARYAAEHDPSVVAPTLEGIAATGREALTEMRRMLGLLRTGDTGTRPQPRLDDIALLVAEAQTAGETVEASLPAPGTTGELAPGVALTAYRVVQEALTNVRKHAGPGARTRVEVRVGADDPAGDQEVVEVLVEDDGRGAAAGDDGHGLGLVGMRERVSVHGGTLEAGARPGGGFRVCARIPE
jgi:signal transduction histidine kinase